MNINSIYGDIQERDLKDVIRSDVFKSVRRDPSIAAVESFRYDDNGKLHCNNGPAVDFIRPTGLRVRGLRLKHLWAFHGNLIHTLDEFVWITDATEQEKLLIKLKYTEDDFGYWGK